MELAKMAMLAQRTTRVPGPPARGAQLQIAPMATIARSTRVTRGSDASPRTPLTSATMRPSAPPSMCAMEAHVSDSSPSLAETEKPVQWMHATPSSDVPTRHSTDPVKMEMPALKTTSALLSLLLSHVF